MARINGYRPSRRFLVAVLVGGGSLSAWGCSNDAWVASADIEVPGRSWTQVTPAEAGFDADELEALAQKSDDGTTNCVAITRNGRLVEDWYFHGTDENSAQEVFSATKSVTSTLIGIAQGDGLLDIDDPAVEVHPGVDERSTRRDPSEGSAQQRLRPPLQPGGGHQDGHADR